MLNHINRLIKNVLDKKHHIEVVMLHGIAKSTPVKSGLLVVPLSPKTAAAIATVGYPPRVTGIVIAPPAPVYPVIVAFPPDTVYV